MTYSDRERDPDTPMVTVAVAVRPGPQRTRAEISGEIDADNCGKVRDALNAALDASTAGLDIDLSALTFCDCSGLHLLLDLHLTATTTGKTLVLHAPRPQFTRLLDLTDTAPSSPSTPHPHTSPTPTTRTTPSQAAIRQGPRTTGPTPSTPPSPTTTNPDPPHPHQPAKPHRPVLPRGPGTPTSPRPPVGTRARGRVPARGHRRTHVGQSTQGHWRADLRRSAVRTS